MFILRTQVYVDKEGQITQGQTTKYDKMRRLLSFNCLILSVFKNKVIKYSMRGCYFGTFVTNVHRALSHLKSFFFTWA